MTVAEVDVLKGGRVAEEVRQRLGCETGEIVDLALVLLLVLVKLSLKGERNLLEGGRQSDETSARLGWCRPEKWRCGGNLNVYQARKAALAVESVRCWELSSEEDALERLWQVFDTRSVLRRRKISHGGVGRDASQP